MPQYLHKQPGGIATGSSTFFQRLFTRLDAGIHPGHIADLVPHCVIQRDQKIDCTPRLAGPVSQNAFEKCRDTRASLSRRTIRPKVLRQVGRVLEWKSLDARLQKKIEGIDGGQICNELDLNRKLIRLMRKQDPRQVVVVGVKLPLKKVIARNDAKRVAEDRGATMRGRTQLDYLRTERHQFVVPVP